MKILVAGSLREKDKDKPFDYKIPYVQLKPQFDAACRALGRALAESEDVIMVGVPDWDMLQKCETACNFVMEGADQVHSRDGKKSKVILYGPKELAPPDKTKDVVDSLSDLKALKHIDVEDRFLGRGEYKAKLITNVNDAEGVIIIGGTDGTASIGYAAYSMHKPTVALPSLGGAAKEVYDDVLLDEYTRLISTTDIRALEVQWESTPEANKDKATEVVRVVHKLIAAYNETSKTARNALMWTLVFQVVLLVAWLATYLLSPRCPADQAVCGLVVNVAFFLLLFFSALLGAGLRTLVAYQRGQTARLTLPGVLLDLVICLIVAFGLSLFYLIGGISFTGTVVVLDSTTSSSFATISISMSLLGLAAGFLVPLTQLRERLERSISQQQT